MKKIICVHMNFETFSKTNKPMLQKFHTTLVCAPNKRLRNQVNTQLTDTNNKPFQPCHLNLSYF